MTLFSNLGLSPEVVRAVTEAGYTTPTPIQEQAIPVALTGRDVLGIAQTGTGKTAAFTLPMIDRLATGRARARMPRSLVLCPTRELADQVALAFDKYAKNHKLAWALLIGGVSFGDQEKKLDRGVDVLIATPGRLLDHFERGKLLLTGVQIMVVDEADRMLDMGFIPDIERIFKLTPPARQTLFFSATMPPEITRLTSQFLKDPTRIEVARQATTGENIAQYVARIPIGDPKAKRLALRALIQRGAEVESGIVFCNRKSEVDIVAKSLKVHGFDAAAIHGDLDQATRMRTLESFRKGELKLLVASDVAARGLDIPAVSHVFNYDVPHHAEDYVHRIGRTGRAGRSGETFMIVTPNDVRQLDKVVKLTKKAPEEVTLELDWASAQGGGDERRDRDRDRKSRERSRTPRDRDRERPRKDHGERASMEAAAPMSDEEATAARAAAEAAEAAKPERAPRRSRSRREPREERAEAAPAAPTEAREPREDRQPREDREPREARAPREAREPREHRESREPRRHDRPSDGRRDEPRRDARREEPSREERNDQRGDRARGGVRQPEPREDRSERAVVGFGSDTPAFLLRPVPVRKETAVEAE